MDDIQTRLVRCFRAVFPGTSEKELLHSTSDSLPAWDSVASVTLVAAIEEEFCLEIPVEDLEGLLSFEQFSGYLQGKAV